MPFMLSNIFSSAAISLHDLTESNIEKKFTKKNPDAKNILTEGIFLYLYSWVFGCN